MATTQENKTDATTAPEGWRPNPGDVLAGTVVAVEKGWSDYADAYYPIVAIRKDDGTVVNLHCFHSILEERMLDARPTLGTKMEVECLGEKRTSDGKRSYVGYRVTVEGETGENIWDDLRGSRRRAGASAQPRQQRRKSGAESLDDDIPF